MTAKRLFHTFPGRLLFWAAVIVAVYTVIGFLLVPWPSRRSFRRDFRSLSTGR